MEKKALVNVLNLIKPGIASKEIIEGMTYFFLNNDRAIAYNDLICIQHPFDFGFSCFIKASDLVRTLSKLKADELTMAFKDDKLNIKCGRSNINLASIEDTEITSRIKKVNKSLKKAEWKKVPKDFVTSLSMCAFCASTNESQGTLTYVCVENNTVKATNNAQLAVAPIEKKMGKMFIKASAIKDIAVLKPTSYSITDSWIHFKNDDDCVFSIRTIKGEFPDIEVIFNSVKDIKGIDIPDDIVEGVDLSSVFTSDDNPVVQILIADNKCNVEISSESGSMSFSAKMKYKGNEIRFMINPEFLLKMLEHSSIIKVGDNIAMIESDGFKIATALMG